MTKPEIVKKTELAKSKFLRFLDIEYRDSSGKLRTWQSVERTNHSPDRVDAVCMLTILKRKSKEPEILLVKQFRPPIGRYTIEMPAGLVDEGETVKEAALRELREECGYKGVVIDVTGAQYASTGLTNESLATVSVEVDMDLPEHHDPPAQSEEDAPNIVRLTLPLPGLYLALQKLEAEGNAIHGILYSLAHGMHLKESLKL